jgi:pyruvate,water dikinase
MREVVRLGTLRGEHAAGAKASTLDALLRAGFPVPDAVVITAGDHGPTATEVDELCAAVAGLGAVPLAVRSSAADEDLADSSAAGRYTTVLGVCGSGPLRAAVAECLASAAGPPMAVIVQRMVVADASGVAFTAHPVTGAVDETLVNAVPGLGDRLVSGELTPDEWVVVGEDVRAAAATSSLDDEQVRAVAALARRAADVLGGPQDIEWAIDRHGLHLLQARPITTLVEPVAVPVDPPPGSWNRDASHGRRPRTPMTRSVFDENEGTAAMAEEFGFLVELRMAEIGGWHYAGAHPVGAPPGRPAPPAWLLPLLLRLSPVARARMRRAREAARTDLAGRTVRRWHDEVRPAFTDRIARLRDTDLPGLDDDALARHLRATAALLHDGLREHFRIAAPTMLAVAELAFCCRDHLGWDEQAVFELLAGTSTTTTDPARALAGLDRDSPRFAAALAAYQRTYGCRALECELAEPTLAERPGLTLALIDAQRARGYDPDAESAGLLARRTAAADRARAGLRRAARARFDGLLERALTAYPLREQNVFLTVDAPLALVRYGVLEAGRRLRDSGALAVVPDVFFCTLDEVLARLRDGGDDLRPTARRRRGEHAWMLAHPGPPTYGTAPGLPPSLRFLPRPVRLAAEAMIWSGTQIGNQGPAEIQTGTAIVGTAASPGTYTGPVRVIASEAELHRLQPGDVLVCPSTRPSWSVVFPSAGAIVTDSGGSLSHPAIIAREHRIPAVVATGCGTAVLHDGDTVTVDGTRGVVHVEY